jgi:hypothetical protein
VPLDGADAEHQRLGDLGVRPASGDVPEDLGLARGADRWLATPLLVVAAAALAWRRRVPLAAVLTSTGAITISAVVAAPIDSLAVVIPCWPRRCTPSAPTPPDGQPSRGWCSRGA